MPHLVSFKTGVYDITMTLSLGATTWIFNP
jgi:hypothetical protein